MTYSYEEFKEVSLRYNRCPNDMTASNKHFTDKQIEKRYKCYLKAEEKKSQPKTKSVKKEENWQLVRRGVLKRDFYSCRFFVKLTDDEKDLVKLNSYGQYKQIDCAHVFNKQSYPWMKYNSDNVVLLNRYSHGMLDTNKNPITGQYITNDEVKEWWKFIVGKERYERLENIAKKD